MNARDQRLVDRLLAFVENPSTERQPETMRAWKIIEAWEKAGLVVHPRHTRTTRFSIKRATAVAEQVLEDFT